MAVLHLLRHLAGSEALHTQACAQSASISKASRDAGPPVQDPVPLTQPVNGVNGEELHAMNGEELWSQADLGLSPSMNMT